MSFRALVPLRGEDLPLELLAALADLTPHQREAWVDRHVLGQAYECESRRNLVHEANVRLRERFVSADRIREMAA